MDPFSLATGLVTLTGAATYTYKALLALYNLRHVPQEILGLISEVSELQALLTLIQKATQDVSLSSLDHEDQKHIRRLIDSARGPLSQLDGLITDCLRNTKQGSSSNGRRSHVSYTNWLKLRKRVGKIRNNFLNAHHKINTALMALSNLQHAENRKLVLHVHGLMAEQATNGEAHDSNAEDCQTETPHHLGSFMPERFNDTLLQASKLNLLSQNSSAGLKSKTIPEEKKPLGVYDSLQTQVNTLAKISASIREGDCGWTCYCQCHAHRTWNNPHWLAGTMGKLFYHYTGTPFLDARPCNSLLCLQRESTSHQLTYHFPSWLARRTFLFTAAYRKMNGVALTLSIEFPRAISASHKAWQAIERNQKHEVCCLLRDRSISSNDMADDDGTPLLVYALKFRKHDIVEILLKYGANPRLVDPRGISAYAYAQSNLLMDHLPQISSCSAHLDAIGDISRIPNDMNFTSWHYLVITMDTANIHQPLQMEVDPIDSPDVFGRSPLHWAVISGKAVAVKILLNHRASPMPADRELMTPLHDIFLAPPSAQVQCTRSLLDTGAEIDALDFWGRTPLRIAVGYENINPDLIKLLICHGADVNRKDTYSQSPLLKSIQGHKETTRLLLRQGANIEARDDYGNTPVLEAIFRNKPEQLRMLLEYGARTDHYLRLRPGRRARGGHIHMLDFVVWHGTVEIMQILESFATDLYPILQPIDALEEYQDFRLANGRKVGEEEKMAMARLLARTKLTPDDSRWIDTRNIQSRLNTVNACLTTKTPMLE